MAIDMMTRGVNDVDLPDEAIAERAGWFMCDGCDHLHVVLRNKDNVPFAGLTLDEEMLVSMLATLRGMAMQ